MGEFDVRECKPKVSVCVLAYNHGPFIAQCLDSLLNQRTTFAYEICIGEDESSDQTREICERYADKYPARIRLFLRSRKDAIFVNGRPTGRFNFIKTLEAARGEYVAICEGDDYWTDENKLQLQVDALESRPDCAICFCNVQVVYEDGTPGHPGYGFSSEQGRSGQVLMFDLPEEVSSIRRLARGNFIHTPGVLFRNFFKSEPLPEFIMSVIFGDWPLYMCAASRGDILYLDQTLAAYRVHSGGSWSCTASAWRLASTIRTAGCMLCSGYFKAEVDKELHGEIKARMRQLWKILAENDVDGFSIQWFKDMSRDFPPIKKIVVKYARKYRMRWYYRLINNEKKQGA